MARDGKGIADDASAYEDLPEPEDGAEKRGIAEDAGAFEGMLEESTDAARSLDSDWLYQVDGQVFGPLKPRELLEMLYDGQIDGETPIAPNETGDLIPMRRYGVFRVHLPKVEKHQREKTQKRKIARAESRGRLFRRLGMVSVAAGVLAGASAGVVWWLRSSAEAQAAREKAKKEAALKKELESLLATVTIQPPLLPLVDETPPDKKRFRKGVRKRRKKQAVARFSGTGELTRQEIMEGVAGAFDGFKRCIVAQIQREPASVPDQIVLNFAINNDGVPQNVELSDRRLRRSPLNECMGRKLARQRWRQFKGEVRNVEYPITINR